MKILVVDDQRSARKVLRDMLAALGQVEIFEAASSREALRTIEQSAPELMLLDIRLSADDPRDRSGLDLLRQLRATGSPLPTVIVTALTEVAEIREAMRIGAQDYVFKDELASEMLLPIVEAQRERLVLRKEVTRLRARVDESWGLSSLIGSSPEMDRVRNLVARVADSDSTILIRGETGAGKERVARAIHELSPRNGAPYIAINCTALPGTLIESMIFGHERGAFTSADRRVRGQFELAGAGTVLLDEIADMPAELQAKLLRVLEDRRFRPLGSETEVLLRARVLAATNADLEKRIAAGTFRRDLFYRLNVVTLSMPSLSERREDIPDFVNAFAAALPRKLRFSDESMAWLTQRHWPGNVRELRNVIERLALLSDNDSIGVPELQEIVGREDGATIHAEIGRVARALLSLPDGMGSKLQFLERAVLQHAIEACGGNKSAASRLLGVDRKVVERRWERWSDSPNLEGPDSNQ